LPVVTVRDGSMITNSNQCEALRSGTRKARKGGKEGKEGRKERRERKERKEGKEERKGGKGKERETSILGWHLDNISIASDQNGLYHSISCCPSCVWEIEISSLIMGSG